ncbi:MAG: glycosyltransferase family 4 protein [Flavobacteriaceae bacterium]|jgi:glycosyltransferase involved in cell wall biosynthesis|nr:glycosyltransferase family 4 protein [Flavobacteriaceae bacterium]
MGVKLIRITTVPISLKTLLKGQHQFMSKNSFEVVGVSSDGSELYDVQKEEGIRVVPLEMTRTISLIRDIKSLWNFYQLCKKEKPLIVHSHTPKAGIVGMLGAKLAGVPIRLHTVAGLPLMEATGVKRKVLNVVEKITYSSATKVYPNSRGLYDFIIDEKLTDKKRLKVIGKGSSNGIDTSFFTKSVTNEKSLLALKKKVGIEKADFVFVFVGRLVGDKGINELVHAFSKVQQVTDRTIKLLLVGSLEAELDPLLNSTLDIINNNKDIISVGFQKDVRPYFAISDVLVFPSYREGFPNVVMQAGAMELPSIVSNINGCNEIIEEGVNGTIIPVKNTDAIKIAMLKLLNNEDYYQQLKVNSRKMITERYEQQVVWDALLEEYNSLITQYEKSKKK